MRKSKPRLRPRKRFGQHFLHERSVIDRIVAAIDPKPGERLVEIGPGLGAITFPLLDRHGVLDAIEIDRDASAELRRQAPAHGELRLHEHDALTFELSSLRTEPQRLRIIGNLPYNISTPLLFRLLEQLEEIDDMHFMLQKEVVDRIVAKPGSSSYGRLTVMLAPYVEAESLFEIGPGAFRPPPKVRSTFFRLLPRRESWLPAAHRAAFARVVASAFAQRRKTLRNALRNVLSEALLGAAGVDADLRAEVLTPADYGRLAAVLVATASLPSR